MALRTILRTVFLKKNRERGRLTLQINTEEKLTDHDDVWNQLKTQPHPKFFNYVPHVGLSLWAVTLHTYNSLFDRSFSTCELALC